MDLKFNFLQKLFQLWASAGSLTTGQRNVPKELLPLSLASGAATSSFQSNQNYFHRGQKKYTNHSLSQSIFFSLQQLIIIVYTTLPELEGGSVITSQSPVLTTPFERLPFL
jgi:hypothetical protein